MTVYLLAHGSPDRRHAEDVGRIAHRLGAAVDDVRPCYLDHCGPTLAQAADTPGTVLPLLLSPGHHVTVDVAPAVAAAPVPLAVAHPPLLTSGAAWAFALRDEVRAAWPGHRIVMVGAGTRDTTVLRAWAETSSALGVPVVHASGPGPRLSSQASMGPAVAVPLLVARGTFSDRIAAEAAGLGMPAAEPAGTSEALVGALIGCLHDSAAPAEPRAGGATRPPPDSAFGLSAATGG